MVGYKFMGKAHSHAYHDVSMFFPQLERPIRKVLCGRDYAGVKQAAAQYGWEETEVDWRHMVKRHDIDLVDINAPTHLHYDICMAAIGEGKHVFCEKPMAMNLEQSRRMLQAASTAGIVHMIGFNYRFVPAVMLAKALIDEGRLGTIYHFRASFLQDWILRPEFPLTWKLQKAVAGSGSLGDLGTHLIDLAHYLIGGIEEVTGTAETFIKERPLTAGVDGAGLHEAEKGIVEVDDATLFLARFQNGALGSFETSRMASGHRSSNVFEVNGSKGSVRFDFERMNELEVYFVDDPADVQGFRRVLATDPAHAYADTWWPPGHTIGYEHTLVHEMAALLTAIQNGRMAAPNFLDGVKCQAVLEAVEQSLQSRSWTTVAPI
jgi:predicted dehydrogenase